MSTIRMTRLKTMSLQLVVSNIDLSLEFYTQQLDFDIEFRYEDFYAGVIKDGHSIHLKSGKPWAEERKYKRDNEDLDIIFSVDKIEELYKAIENRPIKIVQPLRQMPYGKEFYIADPDGYILSYLNTDGLQETIKNE